MRMRHPSELGPDPIQKVQQEVRVLALRVLDAIRLLSPEIYRNVWEGTGRAQAAPVIDDYLLNCTRSHWVIVSDISGPKAFQIFNAFLGAGPFEFSWDPHVCRTFLVPELQRALLLEDLADL